MCTQRSGSAPEELASSVRSLADRAHYLVSRSRQGDAPDADELRKLLEGIRRTRQGVPGDGQADLALWLDNLKGRVESLRERRALVHA